MLAIVQGLTEFLPVSSTAHLAIVPLLLGWKDPGLEFDIALHLGTLVAVLVYFAGTWIAILRAPFSSGPLVLPRDLSGGEEDAGATAGVNSRLLLWFLVVATIPAGIAGIVFRKQAETSLRSPWVMASSLIIVGLIMGLAERMSQRRKTLGEVTLTDSIMIGLAQAFAIIPGVSRSGSTIAAGLFRNFKREAAARFSFLLSTPVIAGAAVLEGHKLLKNGIPADMRMPFIVGILVSAIVGFAAIYALMRYLRTHTLTIFVVYRVIFGIMILALAYFGHYQ